MVMKTFSMNAANGKKILLDVIPKIAKEVWTETVAMHEVILLLNGLKVRETVYKTEKCLSNYITIKGYF